MRILAITNCFPSPESPHRAVFHLHKMRAMAQQHEVRLIVPVPWPERFRAGNLFKPAPQQSEGNLTTYFPTFWFTPRILQHRYGGFFLSSIRKTAAKILRDFRPDLVFGIWSHPDGWAAVKIARELNVPVVIKVIGTDILILGRNPRRRRKIVEALNAADRVIAVNQHLADETAAMGVDRQRISIVQEGIDTELFVPGDRKLARQQLGVPQDARVILFVGNLLMSKGAGVLVQACSNLAARGKPFMCYLVGRGADEPELREMTQSAGLSEKVHFSGPCQQDALVQWYRACNLVALPSFSEGIPNVLREAMQCQRPFVATRVGGIPEISDPATSRLVAPGNPDELAAALGEMLDSPPRVNASVARRYNITWVESFQRINELFDNALQQHRATMPGKVIRAPAAAT